MPSLSRYREKRDPDLTPEPFGAVRGRALPQGAWRTFVIQQHRARRMHWDFRLEIEGALASWAVPRGPSLDPRDRRLAVRTEDHPMEYAEFEGVIPAGGYGAGAVIVWDLGRYVTVDGVAPADGLAAGKIDLLLAGQKLRGRFALVRTRSSEGEGWLLLCKRAAGAPAATEKDPPTIVETEPQSVLSGLTVEELAEGLTHDERIERAAKALGAPRRTLDLGAVRPMLAGSADEPFSRAGWLFELKHDGVRVLAKRSGGEIEMRSRIGRALRYVYPELSLALSRLPLGDFVLDGEICALDERGRSRFELLQRRMGLSDASAIERARLDVPVVLYAFDLLAAGGHDLRAQPLAERKRLLASFVPARGLVRLSDHVEGDGRALYEAARSNALEGIVAKRADSRYEAGKRSQSWLKIKIPQEAFLVVVGMLPGKGSRASIGALMLAWYRGDTLVYAGNVGSGLSEKIADALQTKLADARASAPRFEGKPERVPAGVVYLEPRHVCAVRYTEVTEAGSLRQPVFLGMRDDVAPETCRAPAELETAATIEGNDDAGLPDTAGASADETAPEPDEEKVSAARRTRKSAAQAGASAAGAPELTRLDKIFWPVEGYTKGDLLEYYEAIWPWIGPYLNDRPMVLTRYPDGIEGKSFFQHNAPEFAPKWATIVEVDGSRLFLCNELRTLLYIVNSGAIPLHAWSSRTQSIDRPDWLLLDLDPKDAPFSAVIEIALALHRLLDELEMPHYVKTSGQAGMHVLLPLGTRLDHEQAKLLAEVIARVVCAEKRAIATIVRPIAGRGGRVYVDYMQNGRGKLMAAPLSVRPRPGAPVSMPLDWAEVTPKLDPRRYTIRTAAKRLEKHGDPMRDVLSAPPDLEAMLAALTERLAEGAPATAAQKPTKRKPAARGSRARADETHRKSR